MISMYAYLYNKYIPFQDSYYDWEGKGGIDVKGSCMS
jgi:hypothetical protein